MVLLTSNYFDLMAIKNGGENIKFKATLHNRQI